MRRTDQQSGSVNRHTTQTEKLRRRMPNDHSNKMRKAISQMDKQTPTIHRKAKGGCGQAATHPLTIQEKRQQKTKDPKSETTLREGMGGICATLLGNTIPKRVLKQGRHQQTTMALPDPYRQINNLTIDNRFTLKVSLPSSGRNSLLEQK